MLPLQEAATDLPAALFLFGFVNRVFQGPRHQIWNRNCSLISLEAGWGGGGRWGQNAFPLSLHYAACFSSERITSFAPPSLLSIHHHAFPGPNIRERDMLYAHTHVYGKEESKYS